jgi:carotenoid cleavage dioxygenase-like enzyme
MSRPFPSDPYLEGNFAPLAMEADAHDLVVIGEVPEFLEGALYRNGANPQFAPRGRYHWFDGDGMIHGFFFENGKVSYTNRWVRTDRWKSRPNAPEGEGVLLATVYRKGEHTSDLLVLDAENVEKDPLATIELPTRVPFGFHANWRPASG